MLVSTWRGGSEFTLDTVPDPSPGPGQVVIKVHSSGICGTDIHKTQGLFPGTPPEVLGHEFVGPIVELGEGVDSTMLDKVVGCTLNASCGECEGCKTWSAMHCEREPRLAGGFAEYVLVDQRQAHVLPDGLDPETASMTEPAACVVSCLNMLGEIEHGFDALVVGGGLLGLFTVGMLKLRGAGRIILSEPNPKRLAMGAQFGADVLNDPTKDDLGELVNDLTGGYGVKIGAEAVGVPKLVANVSKMIRPRGNLVLVGVSPQGSALPVDLYDLHYKEITVSGAFGAGDAFGEALATLPRLDLNGVVSGRFPLEDIEAAFAASAGGEGVKYMIAPR
ncbi:MAG: zinc-binding dehydrogenase [Gammaproteobacteria bacterium]|nr:zinc-binding dehydrogenase [Gammaproteobacteria bacterium]